MPQINLLPPEIRSQQRARRLLLAGAGAAGVILVFLLGVYLVQQNTINREEERLAVLEAERSRLQAEVQALEHFGQLQASVERRRNTLGTALYADVAWSSFLNDLSLIMPDDSWLVNVSLNSARSEAPTEEESYGTAAFQGFVFDFPGLAGWLTRLEQVDGLVFVYLTTGSRQELHGEEVISFGANAHVVEDLLSGRCIEEDSPCP